MTKDRSSLARLSNGLRHNWHLVLIILVVLLAVRMRLSSDEDLSLSIGTVETGSYVYTSQIPLFSWDFVISIRPITLPLVYKLLEPPQGYKLRAVSNPASELFTYQRKAQPGFDRVVLFQLVISVLSWCALALAVARHLEHHLLKVVAVALILLFAFSPPLADWDSVVDSISLTLSLLALSFALLIEVAFYVTRISEGSKKGGILILLWLAILILFVFVRDTNQYILPVTALLLLPLLLFSRLRRFAQWVMIVLAILIATFAFGLFTARQSMRWTEPLSHAYQDFIFPYESRITYFKETLGMPDPGAPEYAVWFHQNAPQAYLRFMMISPGYIITELLMKMEEFFSENIQPYYHKAAKDPLRMRAIALGDALHPRSSAVFYLDMVLLAGLLLHAVRSRSPRPLAWLWLATWYFASASLVLFMSYFFDTWGVIRHVVYSIQMYRLFMWIFILVLLDLLLVPCFPNSQ
jgi:hypothetical protein